MYLLDTTILVDVLRGRSLPPAFAAKLSDRLAVSAVTVTELFTGLRSQREERLLRDLMSGCEVYPVDLAIAERAGVFLRHYARSHGLDIPDALIAATAEHHGLKLATLNVKHFPMFSRLKPIY